MAKSVALRELGMNSATMPATVDGPQAGETGALDHFVQRDGLCFAGTHLIIDLWGARRLDDIAFIETTLRRRGCDATLLRIPASFHAQWRCLRRRRSGGISYQHPHLAGAPIRGPRCVHVR